ncbi:cytochrome c oxidase subunit I [Agrobacterium pusense]|uniref:cytochrome c oxidase subunit I n=1 Tax=Agrobacterium pusense TaxID=648995 RepID=UPI000513BEE9|nr:cytochrome c oxidase subunit I [Agrobacterium pusense]ANV26702.1 cytochrome c oxidase subunit I [Rhizobium sp. S41]KGE81624.1 cytochrome B561 [Rhizobium sp. H41]QWW75720.1 cytochrome c oxidase subunit I [Agrobacterium pusense]
MNDVRTPKKHSSLKLHRELNEVWSSGTGFRRLAAVNHTVIGKRFMVTALVFFAIGGFLGMLIRTQLATSSNAFMDAEQYAQVFTMHGTIMMFLFAIPFFEGLSIYVLPKLIGARDLAFPRLSAYGYWCYLFGGGMLIFALIGGAAPAGGWFMYTPLSSSQYSPGINADIWLLGITFVEISAISAAIEIIVTILRLRAPGMSLDRMPVFAWYMLVVAAMMLIGFPPLILGSILLEAERAFDIPFFDPQRGGSPLLWQHLFWLFGHPEVYIIFLPAAGALSTIIPVLAGTRLIGYNIIVAALIAMAFLSFGLWVHHMYTVGIPHVALSFFSAASALVTIPTAIQIFAWLGTIASGKPTMSVPMLHILGFFCVFVIGGLTGVMLAMVPFDQQAHDTHFVVAHLHYVLVGGFLFPMLAGLYYWVPHISGRQPVQHLSRAAFWMIFIGFNLTFFMMHLTGLLGMPRRVFSYPEASPWEWLNLLSSIGSFIMAAGFMLVVLDFALLFRYGRAFRRNPWDAGTLEWAMPTPPAAYAFASQPEVTARADSLPINRIAATLAAGKGYLGFVRSRKMETMGTDAVTGAPLQIVVLPGPSFLPLLTAMSTAAFFIALLLKAYPVAVFALVIIALLFLAWTPNDDARQERGPVVARGEERFPLHYECADAPSVMAVKLALIADTTLFSSLLFGGLFLWISAGGEKIVWPQSIPLQTVFLLSAAVAAIFGALARHLRAAVTMSIISTIAYVAAIVCGAMVLRAEYTAVSLAIHGVSVAVNVYLLLHGFVGLILVAFGCWRLSNGYVSDRRRNDLRIGTLWHVHLLFATGISFLFLQTLRSLTEGG